MPIGIRYDRGSLAMAIYTLLGFLECLLAVCGYVCSVLGHLEAELALYLRGSVGLLSCPGAVAVAFTLSLIWTQRGSRPFLLGVDSDNQTTATSIYICLRVSSSLVCSGLTPLRDCQCGSPHCSSASCMEPHPTSTARAPAINPTSG